MRAVNLDRKITLEERQETSDGAGGTTISWVEVGTYWAGKEQQSAEEALRAGSRFAEETIYFRTRWISGVNASDFRAKYDGDTYDIVGVREIGRREGLELQTERVKG
jgi:SPP1 family predicted phage head-tail adaptor